MLDPEVLSTTWGSISICVPVLAALNGCLTMQTYTYFHKYFHRDHPVLKYTVAIIWVVSTINLACAFWVMHTISVAGYYQPTDEITIPIGLAIEFLAQASISCCVQGIYISRLFRFSRNVWFLVCFCVPLAVGVGLGIFAVRQIAHTILAWQVDAWAEEWHWMLMMPFIICTSVDTAIAVHQ